MYVENGLLFQFACYFTCMVPSFSVRIHLGSTADMTKREEGTWSPGTL